MSAFAPPKRQNQSSHLVSPAAGQHAARLFPEADHSPDMEQGLGNQAMQQLLQARVIRAKLTVSQPGDEEEQEADRVADEVMRMSEPRSRVASDGVNREAPSRELDTAEKLPIRSNPGISKRDIDKEKNKNLRILGRTEQAMSDVEFNNTNIEEVLNTGGQPLSEPDRTFFESRFGYDFSHVLIHTDAKASESAYQVHARAYTCGRHIVFGRGQYHQGSQSGRSLVAHELAHVTQNLEGGSPYHLMRENQPSPTTETEKPPEETPKVMLSYNEMWVQIEEAGRNQLRSAFNEIKEAAVFAMEEEVEEFFAPYSDDIETSVAFARGASASIKATGGLIGLGIRGPFGNVIGGFIGNAADLLVTTFVSSSTVGNARAKMRAACRAGAKQLTYIGKSEEEPALTELFPAFMDKYTNDIIKEGGKTDVDRDALILQEREWLRGEVEQRYGRQSPYGHRIIILARAATGQALAPYRQDLEEERRRRRAIEAAESGVLWGAVLTGPFFLTTALWSGVITYLSTPPPPALKKPRPEE